MSVALPAALQACSQSNGAMQDAGDAGAKDATGTFAADASDGSAPTEAAIDDGASDSAVDGDEAGDAGMDAGLDAGPEFPTCGDASVGAPYYQGDSATQCYYYVDFSCPKYPPLSDDCHLDPQDCVAACPAEGGLFECLYPPENCAHGTLVGEAGAPITVACGICPGGGRRPAGLRRPSRGKVTSTLGAYFAQTSHLEAASVRAFEVLGGELQSLGAPSVLIRLARRSARDEVRHARVMARLARRYGQEPQPARVRRQKPRTLESLARENMVEGCVRETFGAMVATWQAAHARDEGVRKCMQRIAVDETRHAGLAWAVASWAASRLDAAARARIARARRAAIEKLEREVEGELPASVVALAGLPRPNEARTLLSALTDALWS